MSYSKEDVVNIVDNEGLDYALLHYMNLDNIEDKELRDTAKEAASWLRKVFAILEEE